LRADVRRVRRHFVSAVLYWDGLSRSRLSPRSSVPAISPPIFLIQLLLGAGWIDCYAELRVVCAFPLTFTPYLAALLKLMNAASVFFFFFGAGRYEWWWLGFLFQLVSSAAPLFSSVLYQRPCRHLPAAHCPADLRRAPG
jgi:hypothetical protein